jgi:endonuclease-3 related protein
VAIRRETPLGAWFDALHRAWGPQGWWPGRTRFEIIVGAILTQGVSWANVEKAIRALRRARFLEPARLLAAAPGEIARCIRPTGHFNQKARKLVDFAAFLRDGHGGRVDRLFREPTGALRRRLLDLPGIGPETADSILLYAGGRPVFVIDAYTRRILARHGAATGLEPYDTLRSGFEAALPADPRRFNEYHALIVRAGKEHCRRRAPLCAGCPLEPFLPTGGPVPFEAPERHTGRRPGRAPRHPALRTGTVRRMARSRARRD